MISANSNTGKSGNVASSNAQISRDAEYVVFESLASDLASGSTLNVTGILVRDVFRAYNSTHPNGTKLSHLCMNPGHEPGTVDNDTP